MNNDLLKRAEACGARREYHPEAPDLFVLNFWPKELQAFLDAETAELSKQLEEEKLNAIASSEAELTKSYQEGLAEFKPELEELKKKLAEFQTSEFHPDWSMLQASQESLREHMNMVLELQRQVAMLRDELIKTLPAKKELFRVIDDAEYSDENTLHQCYSFAEALEKAQSYRLTKNVSITGLNYGVIYRCSKLVASSSCPICGIDTPHAHTVHDIEDKKESDNLSAEWAAENLIRAKIIAERIELENPQPTHEAINATTETAQAFENRVKKLGQVEIVEMIFEERVNSSNFDTLGYYLNQILSELRSQPTKEVNDDSANYKIRR